MLPRGSQSSFSIWAIPHGQRTPVHAVQSSACSFDERKLAGRLFLAFCEDEGYETLEDPFREASEPAASIAEMGIL
jgi:hypothetical protein